jgi:hypothetical protein
MTTRESGITAGRKKHPEEEHGNTDPHEEDTANALCRGTSPSSHMDEKREGDPALSKPRPRWLEAWQEETSGVQPRLESWRTGARNGADMREGNEHLYVGTHAAPLPRHHHPKHGNRTLTDAKALVRMRRASKARREAMSWIPANPLDSFTKRYRSRALRHGGNDDDAPRTVRLVEQCRHDKSR